jgi:ABC-type transport system involved in cytochrome c biogenesis permease subunit
MIGSWAFFFGLVFRVEGWGSHHKGDSMEFVVKLLPVVGYGMLLLYYLIEYWHS